MVIGVSGLVVGVIGVGIAIYYGITGNRAAKKLSGSVKQSSITIGDLTEKIALLERDKAEIEKSSKERENLVSKLKKKLPEEKVHTVLMDGMSGSGKSTFIARIMSPISTLNELRKMAATLNSYRTLELPICWERDESGISFNHSLIHSIEFFDVAGEKPGTFIDALRELEERDSIRESGVILLLMWDLSKLDENLEHLNKQRLAATYGNNMAKKIIRKIVVFLNKSDSLTKEEKTKSIEEGKQRLKVLLKDCFENSLGEVIYIDGSALDGTHVHNCMGAMLTHFGLEANFDKITGNATSRVAENNLSNTLY